MISLKEHLQRTLHEASKMPHSITIQKTSSMSLANLNSKADPGPNTFVAIAYNGADDNSLRNNDATGVFDVHYAVFDKISRQVLDSGIVNYRLDAQNIFAGDANDSKKPLKGAFDPSIKIINKLIKTL